MQRTLTVVAGLQSATQHIYGNAPTPADFLLRTVPGPSAETTTQSTARCLECRDRVASRHERQNNRSPADPPPSTRASPVEQPPTPYRQMLRHRAEIYAHHGVRDSLISPRTRAELFFARALDDQSDSLSDFGQERERENCGRRAVPPQSTEAFRDDGVR